MPSVRELVGYLWAAPNSLLGLILACLGLGRGGRWQLRDGVLEASGPRLERLLSLRTGLGLGVEAITIGHVVIGRDRHCLRRCREHERVHVRQYARWGPFFLPAYALSSIWQLVRGRDPYRDNHFERQAFAAAPLAAPPPNAGSEATR